MRTLSGTLLAILSGLHIPVRLIARFTMAGPTVYGASDAPDTFTWSSQSYLGFGQAFALELASTGLDKRPTGGSISLSATNPAVLEAAFLDDYRARPVEAGLLFFSLTTGAPTEEFIMLSGTMDNLKQSITPASPTEPDKTTTSTITLGIAPKADQMARPGVRIRSDADQRAYRDADDGCFKDVGLAGRELLSWGTAGANSPWAAQPRG